MAHWLLITVIHSPFCSVYHCSLLKHLSAGLLLAGGLGLHLDDPSHQDTLQDRFTEVNSHSQQPKPERTFDPPPAFQHVSKRRQGRKKNKNKIQADCVVVFHGLLKMLLLYLFEHTNIFPFTSWTAEDVSSLTQVQSQWMRRTGLPNNRLSISSDKTDHFSNKRENSLQTGMYTVKLKHSAEQDRKHFWLKEDSTNYLLHTSLNELHFWEPALFVFCSSDNVRTWSSFRNWIHDL